MAYADQSQRVLWVLGLARYYRKFIRNYGIICRSLTALLNKGVIFCWSPLKEEAFQALKQALVSTPVLALFEIH